MFVIVHSRARRPLSYLHVWKAFFYAFGNSLSHVNLPELSFKIKTDRMGLESCMFSSAKP